MMQVILLNNQDQRQRFPTGIQLDLAFCSDRTSRPNIQYAMTRSIHCDDVVPIKDNDHVHEIAALLTYLVLLVTEPYASQ
jgi:hypothetical protein